MSHPSLASRQAPGEFHEYFQHSGADQRPCGAMSSGYSYGSIRRNGLGGLFSKSSGVGPGQRHGMSGQGVGTVKKARDLVLGDGTQIVVDIVCRRRGHEQPHNYYRCRCQNCQALEDRQPRYV